MYEIETATLDAVSMVSSHNEKVRIFAYYKGHSTHILTIGYQFRPSIFVNSLDLLHAG